MALTPPRRGELGDQITLRHQQYLEDLTDAANNSDAQVVINAADIATNSNLIANNAGDIAISQADIIRIDDDVLQLQILTTTTSGGLGQHKNDKNNPHEVTGAQLGLGTMSIQDADSVAITGGTGIFSLLQLSGGTGTQGEMTWNADEETVDIITNGATLQLGQEMHIHCRNATGTTIANGTPVMASGTLGASGRITIAPMVGTSPSNAKYFLGVTTESIDADTDGKVTTFGKVRGIDTSGTPYSETWADGDVLWVDASTTGYLTNVEPSGTNLGLPIAIVIHKHATVGTLFIRSTNIDDHAYAAAVHTHTKSDITDFVESDYATGAEGDLAITALQDITSETINTLSNVLTSMSPNDNDVLTYDTASGKWESQIAAGGNNIDGGFAGSVYTTPQLIDGGSA